jgi:aminoglycoside phosphotransferase (APT) family kinase protein
VVSTVTQPGGFSPAVAARITAANGERAFVKAAGPDINPDAPAMYRQEARVASALPASTPAPRLLWELDEGNDGWVVLMFEDVEGHTPETPWREEDLSRVMDMLHRFWTETPLPEIDLPSAGDALDGFRGWRALTEAPPAGLDPWSRRHLQRLADLEHGVRDASAGTQLLHFDIRADNLLLAGDRVYLVDWPHASIGDPAVDLAGFAPSVVMQGGPEPEELLQRSGIRTDPDALTSIVAAIAGYFTHRALLPPPPGLPTLRAFQDAQGIVARRWLATRTGWE